jgi:hypothetical protein
MLGRTTHSATLVFILYANQQSPASLPNSNLATFLQDTTTKLPCRSCYKASEHPSRFVLRLSWLCRDTSLPWPLLIQQQAMDAATETAVQFLTRISRRTSCESGLTAVWCPSEASQHASSRVDGMETMKPPSCTMPTAALGCPTDLPRRAAAGSRVDVAS